MPQSGRDGSHLLHAYNVHIARTPVATVSETDGWFWNVLVARYRNYLDGVCTSPQTAALHAANHIATEYGI